MENKNIVKHPAYGLLKFSRISGGDPHLFGSSVLHTQKIRVTLNRCISSSPDSTDYLPDEQLIEAEMSYSQFAELISSMNFGVGTPVTIRYVNGEGNMPPVKIRSLRKQQFAEEFAEKNKQALDRVNSLICKVEDAMSEKRNLRANERKEIRDSLRTLYTELNANREYAVQRFDEAMEQLSTEAKGEVEAFVQNKLNAIAMAAIAHTDAVKELAEQAPAAMLETKDTSIER